MKNEAALQWILLFLSTVQGKFPSNAFLLLGDKEPIHHYAKNFIERLIFSGTSSKTPDKLLRTKFSTHF